MQLQVLSIQTSSDLSVGRVAEELAGSVVGLVGSKEGMDHIIQEYKSKYDSPIKCTAFLINKDNEEVYPFKLLESNSLFTTGIGHLYSEKNEAIAVDSYKRAMAGYYQEELKLIEEHSIHRPSEYYEEKEAEVKGLLNSLSKVTTLPHKRAVKDTIEFHFLEQLSDELIKELVRRAAEKVILNGWETRIT